MEPGPEPVDPLVERRCAECGEPLTEAEMKAALDAGKTPLCIQHAAEEMPLDEDEGDYTPAA